jgi:hypothetical protein
MKSYQVELKASYTKAEINTDLSGCYEYGVGLQPDSTVFKLLSNMRG